MTLDPKALMALARAYDMEDAAQRGEPDPWKSELWDPEHEENYPEWVGERIACAEAGAAAFLAASQEPAPIYQTMCTDDDDTSARDIWMDTDEKTFRSLAVRSDVRSRVVFAAPVPPVVGDAVERVARAIYEADDPWHTAFPWPDLNEKQGGAEGYRNAARAAISAASIPAGVKELDWFSPSNGRDTLERVETCLGVHRVWTHHEANGRWFWSLDGYEKASGEAASKDEAKAAAQADYERRILSCLSHPAQGWREPEGWKLVPVEPTPEMCKVDVGTCTSHAPTWNAFLYRAMLAAAPTAPAGGSGNE